MPDFIATLVNGSRRPPSRSRLWATDANALATVWAALAGLLGTPGQALTAWEDETHALKCTGRLELTGEERSALGPLADRFPLLG